MNRTVKSFKKSSEEISTGTTSFSANRVLSTIRVHLDQSLGGEVGVLVAPGVPGAVFTVPAAGLVLGVGLGIVLVVPAPVPVLGVIPGDPVAGVVPVVVLTVGHGVELIVDVLVPLVVPEVLVDGVGELVGLFVAVVPVPPTVVGEPSVPLDPVPILGEDGVHGLMIWVDCVEGDVVDVPIPVCDWVPTCAANPIGIVRIANVSHFARIFELLIFAIYQSLDACQNATVLR